MHRLTTKQLDDRIEHFMERKASEFPELELEAKERQSTVAHIPSPRVLPYTINRNLPTWR